MSEFNFGELSTIQATSNAQPRLKPWDIYNVKFSGARIETIQGRKDPSQTYTILKVRFDGEDGYYEESIFYPKSGDDVRPTYTSKDGHDYLGASSFDRTMTFLAQVGEVLNPEGFAKMQAASSRFKSFDEVARTFIKITDPAKGKETKLKLVGRTQNGTYQAALPKFVAISKEGKRFCCDNFVGDKLFFTAYEEGKRAEYLNTKPTKVEFPIDDLGIDTATSKESEPDFDSFL